MPKRVVFHETGEPVEVLRIEEYESPPLPPACARVAMRMAPINPADLNLLEGRYGVRPSLPCVAGLEGYGIVKEVAEGVESLKVGDPVLSPDGPGSWCEEIVYPADALIPLPEGMNDIQAATLKVNPSTAWRMLHDFVDLPKGAWVVQNAGNSGVGRHVIQLAHAKGWRTVSFVRRLELIDELLGIGADAVYLDSDESVVEAKSRIGTPGAVLGLNAVGGESATRIMRILDEQATLVTYGGMSKRPLAIATGSLIFRDLNVRGFWLTRWWKAAGRAEKISMLTELGALARAGRLNLPVDRLFQLTDVKQAVLRASEPGRAGKVLLTLADPAA